MVIAFSSLGPTRHHCTICPFHVRSLAITCKKHVCLLIETDSPVEKSSHMFKVCLSPYPPQKHNLPRFVGFVERIGFWKDYRRNHFGKTKAYKINFFKMDICIPIHNLLIYYYLLFLK